MYAQGPLWYCGGVWNEYASVPASASQAFFSRSYLSGRERPASDLKELVQHLRGQNLQGDAAVFATLLRKAFSISFVFCVKCRAF